MGTYRQAELLMKDSYSQIVAYRGWDHRRSVEARQALFDLYTRWGKPQIASAYGSRPGGPKAVSELRPDR